MVANHQKELLFGNQASGSSQPPIPSSTAQGLSIFSPETPMQNTDGGCHQKIRLIYLQLQPRSLLHTAATSVLPA